MNKHGKLEKPKQLNLKDPETYELADKLARRHRTSKSGVVKVALQEKLERDALTGDAADRHARIMAVLEQYWALPDKDTRSADEILGYDENGLPT
jgi:antitoxin VapB